MTQSFTPELTRLPLAAGCRFVRAGKGGAPEVTDGPYPEAKEFLAGFWVVDCESKERAYEIAARVSAAPGKGRRPAQHADRSA